MQTGRISASVMAFALTACGYAGETGEDYSNSLAAKSVWSALQQRELSLRGAPRQSYVDDPNPATDIATIAFPAADGHGYVVFTAKAPKGKVLSIPSDKPIYVDPELVTSLRRADRISPAVADEVLRRIASRRQQ